MTNAELLAKIKAEIERIKESYDVYLARVTKNDFLNELDAFLDFLETLESEKSVPNDLEEAGREYREGVPIDTIIYYCGTDEDVYFANRIVDAFIAGADWQKEQMMKDAVEGVVTNADGVFGYDVATFRFDDDHTYSVLISHEEKRKYGDKVRIIIVKEDSHE